MDETTQDERELRAARNQSLFRTLNARIKEIDDALSVVTEEIDIACECAEIACVQMLAIGKDEYDALRANPRHFAVLPGHVVPDIEHVVRESERYVVVEKIASAGELADALASTA
jgi:hypothetical protein